MNQTIFSFLAVALGGSAGACSRYGLDLLLRNQSANMPFGTIAANLLGCLLIGMFAGVDLRMPGLSPEVRLFFATGFCGGLTTMSSFIYDTAKISATGEYAFSALYAALTIAGSALCFAFGLYAVKQITRVL